MIAHLMLSMLMAGSTDAGPARVILDPVRAAASLRGINAVCVTVRSSAPQESSYGLNEADLRSEVEMTLRANGIRTLRPGEWKETEGRPFLFVHVVGNTLRPGPADTTFFYTISLELIQKVALERNPGVRCDGVTWSEGATVVLPRSKLRTVAEQLGRLASDFSSAVQEANAGGKSG